MPNSELFVGDFNIHVCCPTEPLVTLLILLSLLTMTTWTHLVLSCRLPVFHMKVWDAVFHCCIWNVPPLSNLGNLLLLLVSVASLALLPLHSSLLSFILLVRLTPTLLFVSELRRRHHFFGPLVKASWNLLLLLKRWGVNPGIIIRFHAARQGNRRARRVGSRKTNPGIFEHSKKEL